MGLINIWFNFCKFNKIMNKKVIETVITVGILILVFICSKMSAQNVLWTAYVASAICVFILWEKEASWIWILLIVMILLPIGEIVYFLVTYSQFTGNGKLEIIKNYSTFYQFSGLGGYILLCAGFPWAIVRISRLWFKK